MINRKQYKWLLVIFLIILFIPYIYISQYTNPVADDLIYGFNGKKNELLHLLIRDYMGWNGRYTSNVLVFTNPMAYDSLALYKLAPIIIIALTIISYLFFILVFLEKQCSVVEVLILTLLFSLLFLYQMPILSEGIYWYTGAVTYQLANSLVIIYVSILKLYTGGKLLLKSKVFHISVLTMLLIVCIGFNEIHMIALTAFAFVSLFISRKNKLLHQQLFTYLLLITLVFAAVMYFAPGNAGRAGQASGNHRFIPSLLLSFAQTIRFFLEWTSSIPLLLLSFCYYYLNKKLSENILLFSRSFYLVPTYSIALLFFVIFIAVFPPYWATGILGQHRTLNVAYGLFLIFWFINLTVCFNLYREELNTIKPLSNRFAGIILLVSMASLFFTRNGYDLLTDIFYGKASLYDRQMQERSALMKSTGDTIYFHPIIDPPRTLFLYDITKDPNNWLNKSYTLYFECENKVLVKK